MIPISAIFHAYKFLAAREGGLPLSIAFVFDNRFKLMTLSEILIAEKKIHTISSSQDAFKLVGQLCSRDNSVISLVVIVHGRVRFIPSNTKVEDRQWERPDLYPSNQTYSKPMVQMVWIDLRSGKEPFKKLSVYRQVGNKYEFQNLIDGFLQQPEDVKMVEAVKSGWNGHQI